MDEGTGKMNVMREIAKQLAEFGPKDTKFMVGLATQMTRANVKLHKLVRKLNQLEQEIDQIVELSHYIEDEDFDRKTRNHLANFCQIIESKLR